MAKVSPYKNNSTISPTRDGLEVSIPSRKNWFIIVFLLAWLGGWFFGETSAIKDLLKGNSGQQGFMIFWLVGWTAGGAFAALVWLWNVAGKEVIQVSHNSITYIRAIGSLKLSREYDYAHIRELRVSPIQTGFFGQRNGLDAWGITGGPISFDYGAKTIRIGAGVDEAEAKRIVEEIKRTHKFA